MEKRVRQRVTTQSLFWGEKMKLKDPVRITPKIIALIMEGIEKCGSKHELARILGYYGRSPGAMTNFFLRGDRKVIPNWRINRLKAYLNGDNHLIGQRAAIGT